ncbi:MAG: PilZ domain-containing protein [Nitrospirota bacterium]
MEGTISQLSEQTSQILWIEPRRSVRVVVDFRMVVADKVGLASGQVIDMTARGCGLRLTKALKPGQYLTLMMYPGGGTAAVPCNVGRVQWVEGDRVGLAFLSLSREDARRPHQLCGDRF